MTKELQLRLIISFLLITTIALMGSNTLPDKLWESEKLYVSNIYPNPAVHSITFDYRIYDENTKASIIVRNVIGSEMGVLNLSLNETSTIIHLDKFSSGIYFYTLSIDGQDKVTKKFMVNK